MASLETFRGSLSEPTPPASLPPALLALWWAGASQWERAHDVVQQREGEPDCDWVHAYLHRVEGDLSNAGYWYRRAGQPMAHSAVQLEWTAIATALCGRTTS